LYNGVFVRNAPVVGENVSKMNPGVTQLFIYQALTTYHIKMTTIKD